MTTDHDVRSAPGTTPERPHEPPRRYDDEISLRELYLILRRGLPLILGLAVLAGLAAAAYLWLRPDVYVAETTVVSSPTTVQVQEEGTLGFEPNNAIPFATYEDLATSRATFEATLELLGDEVPDVSGFGALQSAAELERLTGPSGADDTSPLTVVHRIGWGDPLAAARYADAWAAATVEQVRNTLLANLAPAQENITSTIAAREEALATAEDAWRAFLETDASGLELRLSGLESRITQADARLASLDREIAIARGRRQVLLAQVGAGGEGGGALDDATLALLEGSGALDEETASQLRQLATEAPAGSGAAADAAAVLARAGLQQESVELAGLLQEREQVESSLDGYEDQANDLRTRLAELQTRELRLTRELETAQQAYTAVAAIEPVLAFVAELTPGNTRILNDAQVPVSPSGPSTLLVALIAAVVAAMVATVFVFLREAVREPAARP